MATKAQVHRAVEAHFEAASAAAKLRQKHGGLAAAVTYEPHLRRLRIELTSGVGISVPVQQIQGLQNALPGVVKSRRA